MPNNTAVAAIINDTDKRQRGEDHRQARQRMTLTRTL